MTSRRSRVLILSSLGDEHAISICSALRMKGHDCTIWYTDLFPAQQRQSFELDGTGLKLSLRGPGAAFDPDEGFDSVWVRRPREELPAASAVHPEDREYVRSASSRYHKSFRQVVGSAVSPIRARLWANSLGAIAAAESKVLQLALAREVGLHVPRTLVSNDGARIREFIRRNPNNTVQKSMEPYVWGEGDQTRINNTSIVTEDDLPSDAALALTSEIYQECIHKTAEIRATFIGRSCFALQMVPGEKGVESVDWRILHLPGYARSRPVDLPSEVRRGCLALMDRLGIATASFDLMADEQGRLVFAELNQAGQFLWLDGYGLPVLDAFAEFLASGDPQYEWRETPAPLKRAATGEFRQQLLEEESHHRARLGMAEPEASKPALTEDRS